MPTQRQHMKELLAGEEAENKQLFKSLLTAMRPLIKQGQPKPPDTEQKIKTGSA
jgi:tRNA 2-thiocytidine biosynthesis protein TtcA